MSLKLFLCSTISPLNGNKAVQIKLTMSSTNDCWNYQSHPASQHPGPISTSLQSLFCLAHRERIVSEGMWGHIQPPGMSPSCLTKLFFLEQSAEAVYTFFAARAMLGRALGIYWRYQGETIRARASSETPAECIVPGPWLCIKLHC